jgi:cell shape-determining protein MreD
MSKAITNKVFVISLLLGYDNNRLPYFSTRNFLHSVLWQLIAIIWQKQKRRWQIKQSKFTTKLLHNNRNAVIY